MGKQNYLIEYFQYVNKFKAAIKTYLLRQAFYSVKFDAFSFTCI